MGRRLSVHSRRDSEEMIREPHENREEWLSARRYYITATDAAAVMGASPWKSASELFDEKATGKAQKDISSAPYIQYGIRAEKHIRQLAMLDLPYFSLEYHPYDLLVSEAEPYLACTLDGELTVSAPDNPWNLPEGSKGILECKTGSFRGRRDLEQWEFLPEHYIWQGVHQMLVTGWDYVIFACRIRRDGYRDDDEGFPEIRSFYRILDRRGRGIRDQIEDLLEGERAFRQMVKEGRRPPRRIRI